MTPLKQYIIRCFALLLSIAMTAPMVSKLEHSFNHHEHEICDGNSTTHLHSLDFECQFYSFKINTPFIIAINNFDINEEQAINTKIHSNYLLLSDYQKLHFNRRGPPCII